MNRPSGGKGYFIRLLDGSRWLLLGILSCAPWVYGGTRPWTVSFLNIVLSFTLTLWLVSLHASGGRLRAPLAGFLASALLLAIGWGMAWNAAFIHDPGFSSFVPIRPPMPSWPGSHDSHASFTLMHRVTVLLGVLWMAADLSRSRVWRMRLWWSVVLTGISISLLGLVQKVAGAKMIFWETDRLGHYFFATFLYHGNAGAYLNLVLPWTVVLTVRSFSMGGSGARSILLPGSLVCLAAAFSHASKAAIAISILMMMVLAFWQGRGLLALGRSMHPVFRAILVALVPACLVAVMASVGWQFATQRWEFFELSKSSRLFTYEICQRMIPDAGWFGFGPGTFGVVFDRYALMTDPGLDKVWRYAHQDYLQAMIEWGWLGAGALGLLFFGGMVALWRQARVSRKAGLRDDAALHHATLLALAGVALHAMVDFPLQIYSLQLLCAVFVGMGWGSRDWPDGLKVHRRKRRHGQSSALEEYPGLERSHPIKRH